MFDNGFTLTLAGSWQVIHHSPAELRLANKDRHPMELLRRLAREARRQRQGVTDSDNESFPPPTRFRHQTPLHDSSTGTNT